MARIGHIAFVGKIVDRSDLPDFRWLQLSAPSHDGWEVVRPKAGHHLSDQGQDITYQPYFLSDSCVPGV